MKNIKLTKSEFNNLISETCRKILKEDMAYMSDEDIANQYSDMKITYFEINPLRNSEGWKGTFDDIDYDSAMVNDFFVYDSEGNRIAWDYWMPDEQTNYLNDIIRKEIAKRSVKESVDRKSTKSELESDLHNIVKESVNRILNEIGDTPRGNFALNAVRGRRAAKRWRTNMGLKDRAENDRIINMADDIDYKNFCNNRKRYGNEAGYNYGFNKGVEKWQ